MRLHRGGNGIGMNPRAAGHHRHDLAATTVIGAVIAGQLRRCVVTMSGIATTTIAMVGVHLAAAHLLGQAAVLAVRCARSASFVTAH